MIVIVLSIGYEFFFFFQDSFDSATEFRANFIYVYIPDW